MKSYEEQIADAIELEMVIGDRVHYKLLEAIREHNFPKYCYYASGEFRTKEESKARTKVEGEDE